MQDSPVENHGGAGFNPDCNRILGKCAVLGNDHFIFQMAASNHIKIAGLICHCIRQKKPTLSDTRGWGVVSSSMFNRPLSRCHLSMVLRVSSAGT